ncbi:hypothetical protein E2C01_061476 [Portunus trituberculatus]|uniref:Uncharacterized protein n=1 Tax=Portunus trituberculatus TaxID=210409 RepID=A0A5B7HB20_PORTR|nr:hypothetical protein [Portunus trituberculatus]
MTQHTNVVSHRQPLAGSHPHVHPHHLLVRCLSAPVKTDSQCLRLTTRHDAYTTSGGIIHKPSYQLRQTSYLKRGGHNSQTETGEHPEQPSNTCLNSVSEPKSARVYLC